MDEIARRLDAAADDVAQMKSDLTRHEWVLDGRGPGAQAVASALQAAWAGQVELAGRLAGNLAGLSASVRLAGGNYRAGDSFRADGLRVDGPPAGGFRAVGLSADGFPAGGFRAAGLPADGPPAGAFRAEGSPAGDGASFHASGGEAG
ncbi:type VII secretion target [Allorhizocola rhizosphaerae]|uniref:type VII secretion target n=1 Tax=Allorhizocola rhizosphaerae TaxID=1872709 RepID=UPI000E3C40E8|nr:type VII secretion target [Allorhizocola rhizosphaerae]